jgi:uncharacterized protein YecE (DUF72 family)
MNTKIYIGTSGYSHSDFKGLLYPPEIKPGGYLGYYAKHFNSVEINVTFYRLVPPKSFSAWNGETPADFRFVLKGSQYITHIHRLIDFEEPLERYFKNAKPLGDKLLGVLWQFPPSFTHDEKDTDRLKGFVKALRKHECFHSFEFRHPSWFCDQTYDLLRENNMNLCLAHSAEFATSAPQQTSDFVYLRFHGPKKLYESEYSEKEMEQWADKAGKWLQNAKFLCAFFNNDYHGFAIKNAQQLKRILEGRISQEGGSEIKG